MGRRQPTRGSPGGNASTKSYCLVRILGRRRHWSVLFWKWRWWGHHHQRRALQNDANRFFWPKLNDMEVDDMWFQQDGATCHTADATMDILHERFEGMVISRRGDVNWPPRSCDLTPLDFFLWGFLKSQVYANKPQSTDALKANITNAIAQIQPDLCGRVIKNWTTRIRATVRSRGGHLNDVIFHT